MAADVEQPGIVPGNTVSPHQVFLEDLAPQEWNMVRQFSERRSFTRGDRLVSEGANDDALYILLEGSAEVVIGAEDERITTLSAGTVFGEMAFFDGEPRSATVRALEPGQTLRLTREAFDRLAAWKPILARRMLSELARILALRLRWVQTRQVLS